MLQVHVLFWISNEVTECFKGTRNWVKLVSKTQKRKETGKLNLPDDLSISHWFLVRYLKANADLPTCGLPKIIKCTGTSMGTLETLAQDGNSTVSSSSGTVMIGGTLACGGYRNGEDQVLVKWFIRRNFWS